MLCLLVYICIRIALAQLVVCAFAILCSSLIQELFHFKWNLIFINTKRELRFTFLMFFIFFHIVK